MLLSKPWPAGATSLPAESRWRVAPHGIPVRLLTVLDEAGAAIGGGADSASTGTLFWEALLRFPNAPLYATHRARPPMFTFGPEDAWPNYHTMRVLGVGDGPDTEIRHVYLLHNGLNETRDLMFHYRLAAWILNNRRDAVCVIRPLPGHLTRYPFHGSFSETPLDTYLRDPMDLFRQFLRYMIETQWLLSIVAPRSRYEVVAGGHLLRKAGSGDKSASEHCAALAAEIASEWHAAFRSSTSKAADAGREQYSREQVTTEEMEEVVADIHSLLKWRPRDSAEVPRRLDAAANAGSEEYPHVHVVGYSMGGFMAQACFFGWPQVVCSCTNLFAGGALRDLAPTAFAHPEEWQAVLHALRYEFDAALADGILAPRPRSRRARIAGVEARDFRYMKRIFYEVFLQYYRGGYSSRVAEFSRRLLFVVGGDDPIVRTKNVLDAGPPEGMTLLQLADVSHFPGGAVWKAADQQQVEREQRMFWLPEIGGVIARFSSRAEVALQDTRAVCWEGGAAQGAVSQQPSRASAPTETEGLDNRTFETELDRLLDVVGAEAGGWLLVSRNEIPPVFLGDSGFRSHARALHHSEELIARYMQELESRARRLGPLTPRMTLLIPEQSATWLVDPELRQKLFARSETPGAAHIPTRRELQNMLKHFARHWSATGAVRVVAADEYEPADLSEVGLAEAAQLAVDKLSLTMLPDVWIGLAPGLCKRLRGEGVSDDRDQNEAAVVKWAAGLSRKDKLYVSILDDALRNREIRALKVSAAEFNPRYRGQALVQPAIGRALRHWALAYHASSG